MKENIIELKVKAKEKGFASSIELVHENYKSPDGGELEKLLYYLWMCELQKWLMEKHNIVPFVIHDFDTLLKYNRGFNGEIIFDQTLLEIYDGNDCFNSHEECLEQVLIEALKLVNLKTK